MKNKISKIIFIFILAFTINIVNVETVNAQCPMCKMSAESNLKDGGTAGKGLNKGILYLFAAPYLMMGGLAFIWFRTNKKKRQEDENDAIRDLLDGVK
ncbi:MAG: hypothetical protein AB8G11_13765 [Saprospiraceae bacterium]